MVGVMRILALYDIHGNAEALEAVLADPRAAAPDAIVVGGDIAPGTFTREALDRLAALDAPVRWLRGNGERALAEVLDASEAPDPEDLPMVAAALTAAALGEARARGLAGQPLTIELDGVLFCHATPRRDDEILTRLSPPERWAAALAGVEAPLVVAGHTHQQDDRTVGGVRFVNAGSVGLPYEGDGAARWVWIADGVPELMQTEYDAAGAGGGMLGAWPDARSLNASLIEPADPMEITRFFEDLI